MNKIRLLLVEENRLLRDGPTAMLARQKDITVIAVSVAHIVEQKIIQLKPTVILLDLGLRNQRSLNMVEIVKKDFPTARVIVMDLAPAQADIFQFVKSGASGFVLKDATTEVFLDAIRTVAGGGTVLPPFFFDSLFSQIVEYAIKSDRIKQKHTVTMTKRERQIIGFLSEGMSDREICQRMRISPYAIKSHIHAIMEKLALHTRHEIVTYSYRDETLQTITKGISVA